MSPVIQRQNLSNDAKPNIPEIEILGKRKCQLRNLPSQRWQVSVIRPSPLSHHAQLEDRSPTNNCVMQLPKIDFQLHESDTYGRTLWKYWNVQSGTPIPKMRLRPESCSRPTLQLNPTTNDSPTRQLGLISRKEARSTESPDLFEVSRPTLTRPQQQGVFDPNRTGLLCVPSAKIGFPNSRHYPTYKRDCSTFAFDLNSPIQIPNLALCIVTRFVWFGNLYNIFISHFGSI